MMPRLIKSLLVLCALALPAHAASLGSQLFYKPRLFYTPVTTGWNLIFDDEFNGVAVDGSKWNTLNQGIPGYGGNGHTFFTPSNVAVSGGFLTLTGTQSGGSPPYDGGFIFTPQFNFSPTSQYNVYVEFRVKYPNATNHAADGAFDATWGNQAYTALNWDGTASVDADPPEYDGIEWHGNTPTLTYPAYFSYPLASPVGWRIPGTPGLPGSPDLSQAYHVYGMLWTASVITWYIDGNNVGSIVNGQADANGNTVIIQTLPCNLILTMALDATSVPVSGSSVFPMHMSVDYVHVYTNNPNRTPATSQPGYGGPGDAIGSGN